MPGNWNGKRIKLRCDGVYSDAVVWVNGIQVGKHSGGFTQFEIDITHAVKAGTTNTIALSVLNDTIADKLASASEYACHPLGGITRSISLMALPEVNVSSLQVRTEFDSNYHNADLILDLVVAAETGPLPNNLFASLVLTDPKGTPVAINPKSLAIREAKTSARIPISSPLKWDCENPNLYRLEIQLVSGGTVLQTLHQQVGFRQIEVRGNELLLNDVPLKLRGINRHEVHPLTGRSVSTEWHRRDIALFREGNVNLVRTSHYPPDEALLEAADELGMFIECEAPFCWAPGNGNAELVRQQTAEMAVAFRNHPSILFWSVANESKWGRDFVESATILRRLDPTRPLVFNDCGSLGDPSFTELRNGHYWGLASLPEAAKSSQPFYLGEDVHLNAYNRLELATDPSLREIWGSYLTELWDGIWKTQGALGLSIWSGIDDTFYLKDDHTVGYGTWGVLDGWRRKKPEFWEMKKAYSPIRIPQPSSLEIHGSTVSLEVENRYLFTNLRDVKITWSLGNLTGAALADIPPGEKGRISIDLESIPENPPMLALRFEDKRGFVADEFRIPLHRGGTPAESPQPSRPLKLIETGDFFTIQSDRRKWTINRHNGLLEASPSQPASGPYLQILPLNSDGETQMKGKTKVWDSFTPLCRDWQCSSVAATTDEGSIVITTSGRYAEAEGVFHYRFENGSLQIEYEFTMLEEIQPRQIGLVFTLPPTHELLEWKRVGAWDFYPDDHIARLNGSVRASEGIEATSVGPRTEPQHPWRLDKLPSGNNDFCSTKHGILEASLSDGQGSSFQIKGDGTTHTRAWTTPAATYLLAANFSHGGMERFLRSFSKRKDRPLKKGDSISGVVRIDD